MKHLHTLLARSTGLTVPLSAVGAMAKRAFMIVPAVIGMGGCVTTQPQTDGSTKVRISLGVPPEASQGSDLPAQVLTPKVRSAPVAEQPLPSSTAHLPDWPVDRLAAAAAASAR